MTVQAVSRALKILSLFSAAKPTLKISEISELMALPNTTVHGLVKTLCQEGFLSRDPRTRQYSMGLKVVELGTQLASTLRINQMGADLSQLLSISTGQSARIAIWNDGSILITLNTFPSVQYIQYQPVGPGPLRNLELERVVQGRGRGWLSHHRSAGDCSLIRSAMAGQGSPV